MQTFTKFFAFAIVAIAMEKFTAEFLFAKTSDADAKGLQEIQSRTPNGNKYLLRGVTGTEFVIITDGKDVIKTQLNETNGIFYAKSPKITIEYTNDACCKPDKNVLFTSATKIGYKISVMHKEKNYFENWNCSSCSASKSRNMVRTDLQSRRRRPKVDNCYRTRTDDDCAKCRTVKSGQFCYPGTYTIEFETAHQCEDVTFGECEWPPIKELKTIPSESTELCNRECYGSNLCNFYRYKNETNECTLFREKYRAEDCNIRAAPKDKSATECLFRDRDMDCDSMVAEDCEYTGELLREDAAGDVDSAETCQDRCTTQSDCKYWVFYKREAKCILKKDGQKTCKIWSGQKMSINDYDYCFKYVFHKE